MKIINLNGATQIVEFLLEKHKDGESIVESYLAEWLSAAEEQDYPNVQINSFDSVSGVNELMFISSDGYYTTGEEE